ncbi:MAG TPA: sugar phosphate isomerase/epimerase [Cyclobacteriaceae bacterium]|nr:sugar phosphate isomerase/epimerase [Cyclobacteriaceae bacterium]
MKKIFYPAIMFAILILPMMLVSCKKAAVKTDQPIALQLYSVRDDMSADAKGTLAKVGEMGYPFVEAAGYRDGQFYGMSPEEFKAEVEKNGMSLISSHTGRPVPDSANWNETMTWWDACIEAHSAVGVKYIVQPSMGRGAYSNLDTLRMYCDYFNVVGEKCAAKGIQFGYHNHEAEFGMIDSTRIYDFMLQNTDPQKVFFQMDLWWATVGGGIPVDYFKNYPGRFLLWHVKDEKELGQSGKIDFAPLFAEKAVAGVKYYIIEVEEYTGTPLEGVKQSLDYLLAADFLK